MLEKNYFFYLILSLVLLQSCASTPPHMYYAPEEHNMLKVAKKNDIKAAISTADFGKDNNLTNESQLNTQLAYSPIKHLAVFGNFLKWNNTRQNLYDLDVEEINNYKLGSVAIGGYYLFQTDRQKIRNDTDNSSPIGLLVDAYVGMGRGRIDNVFSPTANSYFKMNKTYGQIGIHWQYENMGLSLVHRFGQINFTEGVFTGDYFTGILAFQGIKNDPKQQFRETSFKLFMGPKEIRGYFSYTTARLSTILFNDSGFISQNPLPHADNIIIIGVELSVDEIFKHIKKLKNLSNSRH